MASFPTNGDDILFDTLGDDVIDALKGNDTVTVSGGRDTVNGNLGNDTLIVNYAAATSDVYTYDGLSADANGGYAGSFNGWAYVSFASIESFQITTGSGNDTLTTGAGADVVKTGLGDDRIDVGVGADTADGGEGSDRISADLSALSTAVAWNLANNTFSGAGRSFANFEYFGTVLTGGGNDTIVTGAGFDETVKSGGGTDFVTVRGGSDTVEMGAGVDTLVLDYSAATGSIYTYDGLAADPAGGYSGSFNGWAYVRFSSVENFSITSGSLGDTLTTGVGNDIVNAGAGNDIVNVGSGNDTADGGADIDGVSADLSALTTAVMWNLQANTFTGKNHGFTNFEYFGTLLTGSGNDMIVTSSLAADETINAGSGNDTVAVVNGSDHVIAGAGSDTLVIDWSATGNGIYNYGGPSVNATDGGFDGGFNGGPFVDYTSIETFNITTGSGNDTIATASGNDTIRTGGADDFVDAGTGSDYADGGTGIDGVNADLSESTTAVIWNLQTNSFSAATDTFLNFEYFGTVSTGSGDDVITTAASGRDETIRSGAGNDIVAVVNGSDHVVAGAGSDTLVIDWSATGNGIYNYGGPSVNATDGGFDGGFNGGPFVDYTSIETFNITTGSGYDSITTASGNDTIRTGASDDFVDAGTGSDYADGGTGIDGVNADLSEATTAVIWNLQTISFSAATDTFLNFEYFGTVSTGSGDDVITTAASGRNETIRSGGGNDIVTVVNGSDHVIAGAGSDTLVIDWSATGNGIYNYGGPSVNATDGGFDGGFNGGPFVDYTSIETFNITTGSGYDTIATASGNDIIRTGSADDTVNAAAGNDLVDGGAGTDVLDGGDDLDTVSYASALAGVTVDLRVTIQQNTIGAGKDTLSNFENLTGSALADTLTGSDTANVIDGGGGADAMAGLAGADTYLVDDSADTVTEAADGGVDLVLASASFTLGAEVENLTLTGPAAIDGTGNGGVNVITGNDAANTLDGKAGADALAGLGGNDTYVVDDSGDTVTEIAGGGVDLVRSAVSFTLGLEIENLTLTGAGAINGTGNILSNMLTGNDAANILDGGAGADTMAGMGGDDTYVVDDAGDVVTEALNAGVDTVRSSIGYTLGANLEALVLTGAAAINGIGNELANTLTGNDAANILDGKAGVDVMAGLAGNDTYVVDATGDVITELAGGGIDLVLASATYTLAAEIETLTLTGAAAIDGTGNALANTITGNGANNMIEGAGGDDTLDGGAGNDTASYANAASGVAVTLASAAPQATGGAGTDTLVNFENLTGSAFVDTLTGNAGANTVSGAGGDDTLIGGGGADRLMGGTGTDTAVYAGSFADYDLTLAGGTYTVADRRAGSPDGADALTGVEKITLATGTYAIGDVVNQGPTGVADAAGVFEAGRDGPGNPSASGSVLANDLDPNLLVAGLGERLSVTGARAGSGGVFTSVSGATVIQGVYGTLTINADGTYSYALDNARVTTDQLAPGQVAQDVFAYTLVDLHGVASQATLTVSVTGADDTVAGADTLQVTMGRTSSLDAAVLLGNDTGASGETLSVTGISNVTGGTVTLVDGRLQITAAGASGGFDYVVSTSGGGIATGHVDFSAVTPGKKFEVVAPPGVTAVDYVGGGASDHLTGSAGNDRLAGDEGRDTLDGGAGADRMDGGAGSDTYFVDNVGDQVIETDPSGKDTVITVLSSYVIADNVERMMFAGVGDFVGTGNSVRNVLIGGAGNDTLSGLGGGDQLSGGDGNDTLLGGDNSDVLTGGAGNDRLDGGDGADTARYAGASAGVTVDLRVAGEQDTIGAGRDTLVSIENVSGSGGADTLTGNDSGNILDGGGKNDVLSGNGGADRLIGGAGADTMTGGKGVDTFAWGAVSEINADRVTDFSHAEHDLLDFSAVDADESLDGVQHFTFIGAAAFTGAAGSAYELRYQPAGTPGDLTVQGDVNHDGVADFAFTVHAATLDASDFLLIPPADLSPV